MSQTRARCEATGGHPGDHTMTVTWDDGHCLDDSVGPSDPLAGKFDAAIIEHALNRLIIPLPEPQNLPSEIPRSAQELHAADPPDEASVYEAMRARVPIVPGPPPQPVDWGAGCAACDHGKDRHGLDGCVGPGMSGPGSCGCLRWVN